MKINTKGVRAYLASEFKGTVPWGGSPSNRGMRQRSHCVLSGISLMDMPKDVSLRLF